MPTKALLRSGAAVRAARGLGVTSTLDPAAVLRRREGFASHWKDDSQVAWLKQAGIDPFSTERALAPEPGDPPDWGFAGFWREARSAEEAVCLSAKCRKNCC